LLIFKVQSPSSGAATRVDTYDSVVTEVTAVQDAVSEGLDNLSNPGLPVIAHSLDTFLRRDADERACVCWRAVSKGLNNLSDPGLSVIANSLDTFLRRDADERACVCTRHSITRMEIDTSRTTLTSALAELDATRTTLTSALAQIAALEERRDARDAEDAVAEEGWEEDDESEPPLPKKKRSDRK
jgi:hypothetical protein